MNVFVVTNSELGWDCVVRVIQAPTLEAAQQWFKDEYNLPADYNFDDGEYIFHEERLHIA